MSHFQLPEEPRPYNQLYRLPNIQRDIDERAKDEERLDLELFSGVPPELIKAYSLAKAKARVLGEHCDPLNWEILNLREARAANRVWRLHTTNPRYLRFYALGIESALRHVRGTFFDLMRSPRGGV